MKANRTIRIALMTVLVLAALTLSACRAPAATSTPVPTMPVAPTAVATAVQPTVAQQTPSAPTVAAPSASAPTAAGPTEAVPTAPPPLKVGDLAPDFTLQTIDGQSVTLSTFKGKPVMIVFFATWCPHCTAETEMLVKHYDEIVAQGYTLLSVSLGEQPDAVVAFKDKLGVTWPILMDSDFVVGRTYAAQSIPLTVFLDEELRIRSGHLGEIEESVLLQEIGLGS